MTKDNGNHAQVALFGSMAGEWREKIIIPVLDAMGVSYFHPGLGHDAWTESMGKREAEVISHAETLLMVVNSLSPAFGALAEAGWMAVGALKRGQTFILYVESRYEITPPAWYWLIPGMKNRLRVIEDYSNRARFLAKEHALRLSKEIEGLTVAENMDEVVALLRQKYGAKSPRA